jgi:hypothetical protein
VCCEKEKERVDSRFSSQFRKNFREGFTVTQSEQFQKTEEAKMAIDATTLWCDLE